MKALKLLDEAELPSQFAYPRQFRRAVELGITNLEPWYIIDGDSLRTTIAGLRERYPARRLVPFARRQDNDDIACWDLDADEKVFVIHDFASPGWEQRGIFASFWDWFRKAVEDMIEFDV